MDLHQLRYFLTVARTGSFVRAAEEENVAQPSLSQQIKKLETALYTSRLKSWRSGAEALKQSNACKALNRWATRA